MVDTHRTTTISTRITPELKARVEAFAAARCVGVVLVVERALTDYLDSHSEATDHPPTSEGGADL